MSEKLTKMEADSSMMSDSSDDDEEKTDILYHKYGSRMPKEVFREIRRMRMPEKMIRRMMREEREELFELMFYGKIPRRDGPSPYGSGSSGYDSGASSTTSEKGPLDDVGWGVIPQSQPLDDSQVRNNAGGYGYQVSDINRLTRFIVLGSEQGTYYVGEKDLSKQNIACLDRILEANKGEEAIQTLVNLSGRVAKQQPLIFALAKCARHPKDLKAKRAAYKNLPKLCGTPTQLFQFLEYCRSMTSNGKGWGRAHRIGVANWYLSHKDNPQKLAMQVTKYRQRSGWTHRDILRMTHPKPSSVRGSKGLELVFRYIVKGYDNIKEAYGEKEGEEPKATTSNDDEDKPTEDAEGSVEMKDECEDTGEKTKLECDGHASTDIEMQAETLEVATMEMEGSETTKKTKSAAGESKDAKQTKSLLAYLGAVERARTLTTSDADVEEACQLIRKHKLLREHLLTEMLNKEMIWEALLQNMPMMALVRNLGKMTNMGMLNDKHPDNVQLVVSKLTDANNLKYGKMHPFNILVAHHVYNQGHGELGKLRWDANPYITKALEDAFYGSFKFVESTQKRICVALDISASMDSGSVLGTACNISPREAAAAMAMVTLRTERNHEIVAFAGNMVPLKLNSEMSLEEVNQEMRRLPFGRTDCSLPMRWALNNRRPFDAFIIYTDNETWCGPQHVSVTMKQYRESSGILDAKLIVVAFTSTGFTIADPEDRNMLDVVGFDSAAPEIMHNFILGKI